MATFADSLGRKWEVRVTPAGMRRVKSLTGVNLGTMLANNMQALADLVADPIQLIDVVYCLVKPEADRLGITDEQFGEGLVGDGLDGACDAFLEALSDFFPSRQGRVMRKLFQQMRLMQATLAEEALKQIDQLTLTDSVSNLEALQE